MSDTPQTLRSLSRLAEILDQAGFPVYKMEATEEIPFEQLLVALDEDEQDAVSYPMRLFYQEDILLLSEPEDSTIGAELEESATLFFLLEWQRNLPQDKFLDLYRLLNLWNGILPVGHFIVQEASPQAILFRHALLHDEGYQALLIADLLEMMGFYLNRLLPLLDEWLSTDMPLEEIMQRSELELATEVLALQTPKA